MSTSGSSKLPSCKNCGADGHWTIDCYEPTRKIPAALRKRKLDETPRSGDRNSFKKNKGAIISKYGPPPATPYAGHPGSYPGTPPPQVPYGAYHPPPPGPHYPSYGGANSEPPPVVQSPHGHYNPHPSHGPVPPPGVVIPGPPYSGPSYSHSYGTPEAYPGHHPGSAPPGPPAYGSPPAGPYFPPPPQPHYPNPPPHGHHYPPPHQPYAPSHPYPPPQQRPLPQPHPSLPTPPPHVRARSPHHFPPGPISAPHGQPGPGVESYPPPYGGHPGPQYHPQPPPPVPHSYPGHAFPGSPNPDPALPFGLGSGIRVLPPRPTEEVTSNHSHRKDRSRNWKNRKFKDDRSKHGQSASKNDKHKNTHKKRDGKDTVSEASPAKHEKKTKGGRETRGKKPDIPKDNNKDDTDADSASVDKAEEGEILDEDAQLEWDEKMIFKEHKEIHLADAVAGPLPSEYTEDILIPPAWDAEYLVSKFVNPDNLSAYCSPAWGTPLWDKYKDAAPFKIATLSEDGAVDSAPLQRLLATRRSSINPGPRREPQKASQEPLNDHEAPDIDIGGSFAVRDANVNGSTPSSSESSSPERRFSNTQKDHRPIIDSYRPNYGKSSGPSTERRRNGQSRSPSAARRNSSDDQTQRFQKGLEERGRDRRESSVESDLNSLENELLGISPKSSSDEEKEREEEMGKKKEDDKKRSNEDTIPKIKRRRVKVDSAFSRRW